MSQQLPDRHPRVLGHLLQSLNDWLPGPKASLRRPHSRLSPLDWETCPGCKGTRRTTRGTKCARCEGRGGWHVDPYDRERQKIHYVDLVGKDKRGRYIVPGVDEEPEGERAHAIRQATRVLCDMDDRELRRRLRRIAERDGDDEPFLTALELRVKYSTSQDWHKQLTAALQGMRAVAPYHYQALVLVDVLALEMVASLPRPEMHAEGLEILAECLPADFRAPRDAVERATAEEKAARARNGTKRHATAEDRAVRDAEVWRLHGLGWSSRAISRRLGVSQPTVVRVLSRQRGELAA